MAWDRLAGSTVGDAQSDPGTQLSAGSLPSVDARNLRDDYRKLHHYDQRHVGFKHRGRANHHSELVRDFVDDLSPARWAPCFSESDHSITAAGLRPGCLVLARIFHQEGQGGTLTAKHRSRFGNSRLRRRCLSLFEKSTWPATANGKLPTAYSVVQCRKFSLFGKNFVPFAVLRE